VLEKQLQYLDKVFGSRELAVENDAVVLIKHGAVRRLEEDVCQGIAASDLLCDLLLQIIGRILRLP
jgi:hypothetical protein